MEARPQLMQPVTLPKRSTSRHRYRTVTDTTFALLRVVREAHPDVTHTVRYAVHSPRDVVTFVGALGMEEWDQEVMSVLLLDAQHGVIGNGVWEVTRGLVDSSMVHPREVFRPAVIQAASSVILVHNHPSGDPTPSAEDRMITSQLCAAGTLLGITVRDHVIIGRGRYTSLSEAGLMPGTR